MSISNIQRMQKQFNSQFKDLFKNARRTLFRALEQKARAIRKIDDHTQVCSVLEYAHSNPYLRYQVLSDTEKEKVDEASF